MNCERKRIWQSGALILATFFLATPACPQTSQSEVIKRRQLAPLIRSLTSCIANKASSDPDAVLAYKINGFTTYLIHQISTCPSQVAYLVDRFDKLYGEGRGIEFLDGTYSSDLQRAVLSKIGAQLNERLGELNATEAETASHLEPLRSPPSTANQTINPQISSIPTAPTQASSVLSPTVATPVASDKNGILESAAAQPERSSQKFTASDIGNVVGTYKANEMRFIRDFKGKSFHDIVDFNNARQNIISKGIYTILFDSGNLSCTVDNSQEIGIIADWSAGDKIELDGKIDDVTFGTLQLIECSMKKK